LSSSVRHSAVLLALSTCLAGCQPLDAGAALGEPFTGKTTGLTVALDTPSIELADGGTASDSCDATRSQALDILENNCARCHGGETPGARQGAPPFDCVLDTRKLLTMTSATVKDPATLQPARFLVAGDPDHSRIYVRAMNSDMPPPDVIGLPPSPRPSASDLSVLRQWIASCVQEPDNQVDDENAPDASSPDEHTEDDTH
jgi:hypothetical protein